jgi:ATP-binding cassette subfamily C protein CydCD
VRPVDPRLLRQAPAARRFVLACAAISVAGVALLLVQAQLLAGAVSAVFLDGAGPAAIVPAVLVLAVVLLVRSGLAWLAEAAAHRAGAAVIGQLRAALVRRLTTAGPPPELADHPGAAATLATTGLDGLDGYLSRYLPQLLVAAVVPAGVGARILFGDWVSALIVAATVPLIPVFMILIGLHTRDEVAAQLGALTKLGEHFVDVVAGLGVLTAFGRQRVQARVLRDSCERYRTRTLRVLRTAFLSGLALDLLATLSVALVAVTIGLRLVSGTLELRTGLLVLILAPEVYAPLRALGARFHDSAEGVAAAGQVLDVLAAPVPAARVRGAGAGSGGGAAAPDPGSRPLRVAGLRVAGRSGPVLDGLDLQLAPGEVLGITGASGAGKSTLLDVLLGRRVPDAGSVTVGDTDLSTVDPQCWLERVAWLPQQPRLLAGTVGGNVALGAPSATTAEIRAALDAVGLDLPADLPVGELGAGLSTGQQRRVALARALLTRRPLLLLDEPTEGVDADTEAAVVAALPALLEGRSAIVVTHRPAVLAVCDRIIALPGAGSTEPTPPATQPPATQPPATQAGRATLPAAHPLPAVPEYTSDDPAAGARSSAGLLRWILRLVWPHRRRLALACLASAGAALCGPALAAVSGWLISAAALRPPVLTLTMAIVAVRAFGIGRAALRYVERLAAHDVALRALTELRVSVWHQLVRIGPAATARLRRGDLLARLVGDVDAQQDLLVRVIVPAAGTALAGLTAVVAVGLLAPAAGLALLAGLLVAGVGGPALAAATGRSAARRTAALRAEAFAVTVETLTCAPDLIAFGAAGPRRTHLATVDGKARAAGRRTALARGAGAAAVVAGTGAAAVAGLVLGAIAVRAGSLPGPVLAVLVLTPLAVTELLAGLPDAAVRLLAARPAAARLRALAATPSPVRPVASPLPLPDAVDLCADRLAVRWPGAADPVVRGVDLRLGAGQRLALVGPSGSGKSTVLAALLRQLDPCEGRVEVGEVDATLLDPDAVRSRIAWCGPDPHLFDASLRANLLLAGPDATDERLLAALDRVRLGDWVRGLPEGLDTPVGPRGRDVSGGERQRLGLARAVLSDRPVLLLDEPTAHLDAATATALSTDLMATDLAAAADGRATVLVSHRRDDLAGCRVVTLSRSVVDLGPAPGGTAGPVGRAPADGSVGGAPGTEPLLEGTWPARSAR